MPLVTLWIVSVPAPATTAAVKPVDGPAIPVAQLLAIIVNDGRFERVVDVPTQASDVVVTRGPGGCPPVAEIKKGLPLCAGDQVRTSVNVKLKLLFGDPAERNEVTLAPNSTVTISSISCGSICRWFNSLRSRYTNRIQNVALTNNGTVYEASATGDGSAQIIVYSGQVEITKPAAQTEASPESITSSEPTSVSTPSASSLPILERVDSLFKITINADGTLSPKTKMTQADLCRKLEFTTTAEIAIHNKPADVGGNVANIPNFPNDVDRNDKFGEARCASFWEPDQPQNFETLGMIYNDWGDTQQALEYFDKATSLYRTQNQSWQPREELSINKAIAFRYAGQYDEALAHVEAVLAKRDPDRLGEALNVRGSIFYNQARLVLRGDRTETGDARARELLEKAKADYEAAEGNSNTRQQQYIQVNLGQVLKTQGDIAQRERRFEPATQHYVSAIKALMASYGPTENRQNKVAGLLVARARAALADTYAALDNAEKASEFYTLAEATYKTSISDAEKDHQRLAAGYCGLASLYQILGKEKDAQENYEKCVAFNILSLVTDVEVPNVIGLTRPAAIHAMAEAGLEAEFEKENDGEVVETQQPEAKQIVKTGTKIKIHMKFLGSQR